MFRLFVLFTVFTFGHSSSNHKEDALEKIAGFQPLVDVRDYADLDLDLVQMEKLLQEKDLESAKKVYELGAHSRSFATLSLGFEGLPGDVTVHTVVSGFSVSGDPITGVIMDPGKLGDKEVRIQYHNDENPVKCFVGGNPESTTEGCFAAAGQISFDHTDKVVPYSYNVQHQNNNDRVLMWLSSHAEAKMRPCPRCDLFDDFAKYFLFYGKADFAHRWVMAAVTGSRMVFDSSAVDLKAFGLEARSAAAKTAIATMTMFPYVIRQLEVAVHECRKDCSKTEGCGDAAVRLADSAVALYAGSLEDGSGSGTMLYSIAEEECKHFNTCKKGKAAVNTFFLNELEAFQTNITNKDCWDAHAKKDKIARQMKVPLVQGTLRYAYQRAHGTELAQTDIAVGAAFASSIVPLVASCSFKDAEIIDNNMETTAENTDFTLVKETLEKHYGCLGITCKDVGGVWDSKAHKYMDHADPCTFDEVHVEKPKRSKKKLLLGLGIPLCFLVIIRVKHVLHQRYKKRKEEHPEEFSDSEEDDNFDLHLT